MSPARPIETHWLAFRETVLGRDVDPALLHTSRLAFYSAASAVLAELAATRGSVATLAAMNDELDAFVFELVAEQQASRA